MNQQLQDAIRIRQIYCEGCEFPEWVVDKNLWDTYNFSDTIAFYHKEDILEDVQRLALQREPCNIGMRRLYDGDTLHTTFGWKHGAYGEKQMPNFAVYCHANVYTETKGFFQAHVLNLIGCALDSSRQPDVQNYPTKESVIEFYSRMWRLSLESIQHLKKTKFHIYNVGGGAFAGPYGKEFIKDIFMPAFLPLLPEFEAAGIQILGYDVQINQFNGGYIPEYLNEPTHDFENTVYVNAWDPWSLIGNGNELDHSLDGAWGKSTNMSVLGWLQTNPVMKFVGV